MFIYACRHFGKLTSGGLFLSWLIFTICGAPELYYWLNVSAAGKVEPFFSNKLSTTSIFSQWRAWSESCTWYGGGAVWPSRFCIVLLIFHLHTNDCLMTLLVNASLDLSPQKWLHRSWLDWQCGGSTRSASRASASHSKSAISTSSTPKTQADIWCRDGKSYGTNTWTVKLLALEDNFKLCNSRIQWTSAWEKWVAFNDW